MQRLVACPRSLLPLCYRSTDLLAGLLLISLFVTGVCLSVRLAAAAAQLKLVPPRDAMRIAIYLESPSLLYSLVHDWGLSPSEDVPRKLSRSEQGLDLVEAGEGGDGQGGQDEVEVEDDEKDDEEASDSGKDDLFDQLESVEAKHMRQFEPRPLRQCCIAGWVEGIRVLATECGAQVCPVCRCASFRHSIPSCSMRCAVLFLCWLVAHIRWSTGSRAR